MKIPLLTLLALISTLVSSQTYNGDLTLTTQAEVDNFNYSIVTGYLKLNNSTTDPIKNLHGLSELREVRGQRFHVNADSLTSLDGLENLTTVLGYLDLYGESLEDMSALNNLTKVTMHFLLSGCKKLKQIDCFNSLTYAGYIHISNCESLTEISGFNAINSILLVKIEQCTALNRINGFSNLNSLDSYLQLKGNTNLQDISGFSSITQLEGNLLIRNNESLSDFSPFCSLINNSGVQGDIELIGNASNPTSEELMASCNEIGVTSSTLEDELLVYPNPTQNKITINCQQFIEANIYSSTGRLIATSNTPEMYVGNLLTGLYLIKVKTKQSIIQSKLIKQ